MKALEINQDKIFMVSARSNTGPYIAAVDEEAAEALLEDTIDIQQINGDGEGVFTVKRLDAFGRTEASAARYTERAYERSVARADRTRPKKHLRAFIDYPELYMALPPEALYAKTTIVKKKFLSGLTCMTESKVEINFIQAKSAEYDIPYNSVVAFIKLDPPLSDEKLSRLDWGSVKFIDDGAAGQMAKVRFAKQTASAFGLAPCCFRALEECNKLKEQSETKKCNAREQAYDKRRAFYASQREQNFNNMKRAYIDEKAQRDAAKKRRLEEANNKVRSTPCKRFWDGKCTRVYSKCTRTHGSLDEAAAIMCASCEGPNYDKDWVCGYAAKGVPCPFLHTD